MDAEEAWARLPVPEVIRGECVEDLPAALVELEAVTAALDASPPTPDLSLFVTPSSWWWATRTTSSRNAWG